MSTSRRTRLAIAAAAGLVATLATMTTAPGHSGRHDGHHLNPVEPPVGVDFAHEPLQPGYLDGRTVVYRPAAVPQSPAPARQLPLYEVEYPTGWRVLTARPQCTYCDHNGDGRNAWDYHDHVLARRPRPDDNRRGEVYWHVFHVRPAYTGDAAHDHDVSVAYAAHLPTRSRREVERLLSRRMADDSPVATTVDTGFFFQGPIVRW